MHIPQNIVGYNIQVDVIKDYRIRISFQILLVL